MASALRGLAAEIEDAHGVSVEVVSVGTATSGAALLPVVAATREAVTNAAKHAGTGKIDVYAEITAGAVDVFVRDRGAGSIRRPRRQTGTLCGTALSTGWPVMVGPAT